MAYKSRVLIIDDDPSICESVKAVLDGNGYETIVAFSGREGLEAFRRTRADLVLCDMMMEDIDSGINVAVAIKQENKAVPVLLLSTIGNATTRNIELSQIGFDGAFQKPVDFDKLLMVIGRCTKRSSACKSGAA